MLRRNGGRTSSPISQTLLDSASVPLRPPSTHASTNAPKMSLIDSLLPPDSPLYVRFDSLPVTACVSSWAVTSSERASGLQFCDALPSPYTICEPFQNALQ